MVVNPYVIKPYRDILKVKSWPDGRAVLLEETVRKVRTLQGSTVANGDHRRSDSSGETGQQKAFLFALRGKVETVG